VEINQSPKWHARHLRLNAASEKKLFLFVEEKLKEGRIRRSTALNACTPMLVKKQDGLTERLVIDLTPLNKISNAVSHKGPRLEDILQRASQFKFFSKIDIKDAFWLLTLHPDSRYLTAFDTPWGTFEYNCLPQGWCNSPAYWQRYITYVLTDLIHSWCSASADDILIFGMTHEECMMRTRVVRSRLNKASVTENKSKSILAHRSVSFFGISITHKK